MFGLNIVFFKEYVRTFLSSILVFNWYYRSGDRRHSREKSRDGKRSDRDRDRKKSRSRSPERHKKSHKRSRFKDKHNSRDRDRIHHIERRDRERNYFYYWEVLR